MQTAPTHDAAVGVSANVLTGGLMIWILPLSVEDSFGFDVTAQYRADGADPNER